LTVIINSAETGLTDGTPISAGNSDDGTPSAGTPISSVDRPGSSLFNFSTAQAAHGSMSWIAAPTSGNPSQVLWNITGKKAQFSFYFRTPSIVTADVGIFAIRTSAGASITVNLKSGTNNIQFLDFGANVRVGGSPVYAVPVNTWIRVEGYAEIAASPTTSPGNGVLAGNVYVGDSLTPVLSGSTSIANLGTADHSSFRMGRTAGAVETTAIYFDSFQGFTSTDATGLGVPWALEQVEPTVTRVSNTAARVTWTHPDDAPDGMDLVRCDGAQTNDGAGRAPSDAAYDPLTISGAEVVATGLVGSDSPYDDTGIDVTATSTKTWWLVRTP
jgi:hypothetical protein